MAHFLEDTSRSNSMLLGVLLVGSWDFTCLGFYMNHNEEAKSLTFWGVQKSVKANCFFMGPSARSLITHPASRHIPRRAQHPAHSSPGLLHYVCAAAGRTTRTAAALDVLLCSGSCKALSSQCAG